MTDATDVSTLASAGFRLGDPISLSDLLSLPPDGRRYVRDEQGKLALMAPDSSSGHRHPLALLLRRLVAALPAPHYVAPEAGVGFEPVLHLQGQALGPSRLGHKKLEPDLAVWEATPRLRDDPRGDSFSPAGLKLVVEVLSPGTVRSDLGLGEGDAVDRWATFRANGVPEYWALNASDVPVGPLPPFSGVFVAFGADGAAAGLSGEELVASEIEVHGVPAVTGGRLRSRALPDLVLDLDAFWEEVRALGA